MVGMACGGVIRSKAQRNDMNGSSSALTPQCSQCPALQKKYPASTQLPMQSSSEYVPSPAKLATDYLAAMHRHAEYMLLQTVTEAALRRTPREYVITVPAVWSEMARDLTSTCAVDAGMGPRGRLHIVSEPEAAAMYAFKEMNLCGLDKRDTFVVCDAGGGYVQRCLRTATVCD